MVNIVAIARVELVRMLRERSNVFFVFIFPLLLVVLIGASFGEGGMDARAAVHHDPDDAAAARIVERLDGAPGVHVVEVTGDAEVVDQVERGAAAIGVVLPPGLDAALDAGEPLEVRFVSRPDAGAAALRAIVEAAVDDEVAAVDAAMAASVPLGGSVAELRRIAEGLRGVVPRVEVDTTQVGSDELGEEFAGLGQFDLGASSQLFLFTFLTALAGSASLILTRQYGVAHRMAATPTPMGSILAGQAAGRIVVALTQAVYIIVATLLLFRVNWGDPLATGVVVLLFSILSGAAGMLLGAVASNDSQAAGLGVGLGLGLAALGGSMAPIEVFPEVMRTIAHVTPHAWANRAMAEVVRRDGGLADIWLEVAVLVVYGASLLALATWRLRRSLIR